MSSPMSDLPEHYPINVNINGDGPAFGRDIARTVCWCGDPECRKHLVHS